MKIGFPGFAKYFNGTNWVALRDYSSSDMVLQYNKDGSACMVKPIGYSYVNENTEFYKYSGVNLSSVLCCDNNIIYMKDKCINSIKQCNILNGFDGLIPVSFEYYTDSVYIVDSEIINLYVDLLLSDEPFSANFLERVYSLSKEYRILLLNKLFDNGIICNSGHCNTCILTVENYEKFRVIYDLLSFSGECVGFRKNTIEGKYNIIWMSRYEKVGKNYYTKYQSVISQNKNITFVKEIYDRKYEIYVPSSMIVLKFGDKIIVTGDAKR